MSQLSVMVAVPRYVEIVGVECLAPKLRVRDIAALEDWFLEVLPEKPTDPAQRAIVGDWPPKIDGEFAARLMGTVDGKARLLLASLGQSDPSMTLDDAILLAENVSDAEYAAFRDAIYPAKRPRSSGASKPMDWHSHIIHALKIFHLKPSECFDLPLDTFYALFDEPEIGGSRKNRRSRGAPDEPGRIRIDPPNYEAETAIVLGCTGADGKFDEAKAKAELAKFRSGQMPIDRSPEADLLSSPLMAYARATPESAGSAEPKSLSFEEMQAMYAEHCRKMEGGRRS